MRPMFDQLVADYQAAARKHAVGRQPWINYNILADLVRSGWCKEHSAAKAIDQVRDGTMLHGLNAHAPGISRK